MNKVRLLNAIEALLSDEIITAEEYTRFIIKIQTSDESVVCPLCKINKLIEGYTVCLECMEDSVK